LELVAQGGLLSLVVLCAALAWRAQRRGPHELGRIAAAGAGAVLAYVASELLKVLVAQSRPCAGDVDALLTCPALSDYSWPSNHATIAGALATAAMLTARRLAPLVVPVAVAVATARVIGGVHYLHDATAGLLLGAAVVMLATVLLAPLTERAFHRLDGFARGRRDTPELTRQPVHHTTRK
jgi:undecaprenyl-diphosphatase